jgi:hypothetical protein
VLCVRDDIICSRNKTESSVTIFCLIVNNQFFPKLNNIKILPHSVKAKFKGQLLSHFLVVCSVPSATFTRVFLLSHDLKTKPNEK